MKYKKEIMTNSEIEIENLIEETAKNYDFEEEFNSDDLRYEVIENINEEDFDLVDKINSLNFIVVKRDSDIVVNYFNKHISLDDYIVVDRQQQQ